MEDKEEGLWRSLEYTAPLALNMFVLEVALYIVAGFQQLFLGYKQVVVVLGVVLDTFVAHQMFAAGYRRIVQVIDSSLHFV